MNVIIYFVVSLVLSFLGSLPMGLITLTIAQRTIEKGRNAGMLLALGATVMEFVYTYIALISLDFFTNNTHLGDYIKIFATIIFLLLGIYFLFKKSKTNLKPSKRYDYFDFFRGIVIGAMNLLILPFWIFIAIWLESNEMFFEEGSDIFIFSLGSAIGALMAFVGYILLSEYILNKTDLINRYANKAIGVLFLGLGIFQLGQIF